jgi:hypothetical protein
MFGSTEKTKIDHFREISSFIVNANPNGLTATQKKALTAISEKLSGSTFETLTDLVGALSKKSPTKRKPTPKKPAMDAAQLKSILANLDSHASDRSKFEAQVDHLNKVHSAPELKKIAASFAAGARPKTKAEAVRILKAERNDRERATAKAAEAGRARPW